MESCKIIQAMKKEILKIIVKNYKRKSNRKFKSKLEVLFNFKNKKKICDFYIH